MVYEKMYISDDDEPSPKLNLKEIFWNLEKGSTKWSGYFDVYERHLSKFIGKAPRILEIGVLGGGSIEMWLKYFGEGTQVIGVDINEECLNYKYDGDAKVVMGDQSNPEFWDHFLADQRGFDIVIDDSQKESEKIVKSTFKSFLEKVDKETYDVVVCENKIIFKSQETSTLIALNLAITE